MEQTLHLSCYTKHIVKGHLGIFISESSLDLVQNIFASGNVFRNLSFMDLRMKNKFELLSISQ